MPASQTASTHCSRGAQAPVAEQTSQYPPDASGKTEPASSGITSSGVTSDSGGEALRFPPARPNPSLLMSPTWLARASGPSAASGRTSSPRPPSASVICPLRGSSASCRRGYASSRSAQAPKLHTRRSAVSLSAAALIGIRARATMDGARCFFVVSPSPDV
jgi:hypothetical protein